MSIKRTKVNTRFKCGSCGNEKDVWCGYNENRMSYECRLCGNLWEHGPEVCSFRQIKSSWGNALVVFHGAWLDEEIKTVENSSWVYSKKQNDEWSFYRGKNLYSAWRLKGQKPKVLMASDLKMLVKRLAVSQGLM